MMTSLAHVTQRAGALIRKQPLGAVGLVLVLIVVLAAVFARQLARYGPEALSGSPLTG